MQNNEAACVRALWANLSIQSECEQLYRFIESTEQARQTASNAKNKQVQNDNVALPTKGEQVNIHEVKANDTCNDKNTLTEQNSQQQQSNAKGKHQSVNESISASHMELVHSLQHQLQKAQTQILQLQSKLMKSDVQLQCATALQQVHDEKIHNLRSEVQNLTQHKSQLQAQKVKLQEQLCKVKSTLKDVETHVQSQLTKVYEAFHTYFVVQWTQMQQQVNMCKEQVTSLVNVNTQLECKVQQLSSKLLDYDKLQRDKTMAQICNKELHDCLDSLTKRWQSARIYFDQCKVQVQHFVKRVQELENERDELQCTLQQSMATNEQWERKYFTKSSQITGINSDVDDNITKTNATHTERSQQQYGSQQQCQQHTSKQQEQQANVQNSQCNSSESNDVLINALQCKIVDLALHLQDAQTRCSLVQSVNHELQSLLYKKVFDVMLTTTTTTRQNVTTTSTQQSLAEPSVKATEMIQHSTQVDQENTAKVDSHYVAHTFTDLCKVNQSLSAKLVVCKSGLDAIMEVYKQLLQMYTDETAHTYELQMQLAEQQVHMHTMFDE